jgi:hypothetical protein
MSHFFTMRSSFCPRLFAAIALAIASSLAACRSNVQFYEKAAFADPVMDMAEETRETHWYAKIYFSLEGSIGGIGTSGGGGCGCY